MIELKLQPSLEQTLQLFLSPRLLQMLKALNLPYADLMEVISQEAEENVLLEVERKDEYVEFIRYLTSDKKIKSEADFKELPGLENISRVSKTLTEHLREQLELEDLDGLYQEIGKEIINNIDDHGYLLEYPSLRQKIMDTFKVSRPTVDKVLNIIQTFEPDGVGARNLKECLLIQIREYNFENEELQTILEKVVSLFLEEISQQKYSWLAAKLGLTEKGVAEIASFIKNNLNPYPGSTFGSLDKYVIPSFAIEIKDNHYQLVNLEARYGPMLSLSPKYLEMLEDPKTDTPTKEFLKEKLKRAKNLIEDFAKRSETLEKILRKIIETQKDFLAKGVLWLKPLSQKELAKEFGLHPSTISRGIAQKYVQTPQGLYALKFLCPRGPKGLTVARMKNMIFEIIRQEDKNKPLSDQQITKLLQERGVDINRRTVAYYRQTIKILPASLRETTKNE